MSFQKTHTYKIRYLDGKRLKNAILASGRIIEKMQEHLNKINVFPVPDGDTGTNMAITMNQITADLSAAPDKSITDVSSKLAEAALMGAQGNSGAILAQFFHGFAEGVKGKLRLSTAAFAAAVQKAKMAAYDALSEPKEGTILTVITDWANYIENAAKKTEDFSVLFKNGLLKARQSLAETPKKLEVLRKAGVVDAGAQGFVHFLEGISNFIDRGKIAKTHYLQKSKQVSPDVLKQVEVDLKFRFCTECIISGTAINHPSLKIALADMGDSLIVAGGKEKLRVHIHTNSPDEVFKLVKNYGEISSTKVDDMLEQQNKFSSKTSVNKIGIVTDTSCDLPYHFIQENHIHFIPLKLIFGSKVFLDKVDLTPVEFYDKLIHSTEHPTTSQPAIADIKNIYEEVVPLYERIISIHIPRAVSGTLQSIEKAAEMFGENKITCIDGKNISGALGLVVMEAVEAIKENRTVEQVVERIKKSIENIHIFITLPTVKYLVKGGRLSKPKGLIGRLLRLSPIVSFNKEGKVYLASKALGQKASMKKTLRITIKMALKYKRVKFIVAHANAYSRAEWFVNQLKKKFDLSEKISIVDTAPALGVHAGPGTSGIAFIGYND